MQLAELISSIAKELGFDNIGSKDMGKIMGLLGKKAPGQYDGATAKNLIQDLSLN